MFSFFRKKYFISSINHVRTWYYMADPPTSVHANLSLTLKFLTIPDCLFYKNDSAVNTKYKKIESFYV